MDSPSVSLSQDGRRDRLCVVKLGAEPWAARARKGHGPWPEEEETGAFDAAD